MVTIKKSMALRKAILAVPFGSPEKHIVQALTAFDVKTKDKTRINRKYFNLSPFLQN